MSEKTTHAFQKKKKKKEESRDRSNFEPKKSSELILKLGDSGVMHLSSVMELPIGGERL